jgi:hypothetical protein
VLSAAPSRRTMLQAWQTISTRRGNGDPTVHPPWKNPGLFAVTAVEAGAPPVIARGGRL